MKNRVTCGVIRLGLAALCLAALILNYLRTDDYLKFFRYFTIQSNMFAFALLTVSGVAALMGRNRRETDEFAFIRGYVTLLMVVVGIIFHAILAKESTPDMFWAYPNLILHYVMPVAILLNWLLLSPKGLYKWRHVGYWLVYPIVYVSGALYSGYRDGYYVYSFLNPVNGGYSKVFITVAVMLAGGAVLGAIFVGIDKALGRRRSL